MFHTLREFYRLFPNTTSHFHDADFTSYLSFRQAEYPFNHDDSTSICSIHSANCSRTSSRTKRFSRYPDHFRSLLLRQTNTSPIHDSPCTLFRTQPSYIDQLWLKLSLLQNYHDCFQFLFCTTKARMSLILTTANTHSGKLLLQYYRLMLLYIQSLVLRVRIITWSCRTRLERRPRNYLTKHTGR